MFYCRNEELRKLNKRYDDGDFECIVMYGRRRVGKRIIKKICSSVRQGKTYHYYIFSKGRFTEALKDASDRGEVKLITVQIHLIILDWQRLQIQKSRKKPFLLMVATTVICSNGLITQVQMPVDEIDVIIPCNT